jgi:hypothetical protein
LSEVEIRLIEKNKVIEHTHTNTKKILNYMIVYNTNIWNGKTEIGTVRGFESLIAHDEPTYGAWEFIKHNILIPAAESVSEIKN